MAVEVIAIFVVFLLHKSDFHPTPFLFAFGRLKKKKQQDIYDMHIILIWLGKTSKKKNTHTTLIYFVGKRFFRKVNLKKKKVELHIGK